MIPEIDICDKHEGVREKPHCWCVRATVQHGMPDHADMVCCWCGKAKCFSIVKKQVPGHGPHRVDRVVE